MTGAPSTNLGACPPWCRIDHSEGDTHHVVNTHFSRRFEDWKQPFCVRATQSRYEDDTSTHLELWLASPRRDESFPPKSHAISVMEARGLVEGLTKAVRLPDEMALAHCPSSGEPLVDQWEVDQAACSRCWMQANRERIQARRSSLTLLP